MPKPIVPTLADVEDINEGILLPDPPELHSDDGRVFRIRSWRPLVVADDTLLTVEAVFEVAFADPVDFDGEEL